VLREQTSDKKVGWGARVSLEIPEIAKVLLR
jgi:hypothetical protein